MKGNAENDYIESGLDDIALKMKAAIRRGEANFIRTDKEVF